ncbi:MAG: TauD/TfdA family dioxygenase [Thiomargarita sp.]|nr:TauD/TfdA family dioxygenase [Thiomargarita sp.]
MNNQNSPFSLENEQNYQTWRVEKLANYPRQLSDLIVEINNPSQLTLAERAAILQRCKIANMAIYASHNNFVNKNTLNKLSQQFGLSQLDNNLYADEDAITSLKVASKGTKQTYIPYTNKPIQWHTDGYYNPLNHQIHGMILHCVQNAQTGGENALLDPEIAYILLRDENPKYIQVLMQTDVMCIPANIMDGKQIRPEQCGPVFSIRNDGKLHTRYTKRTRSIVWKSNPMVQQAVQFLVNLLDSDSAYIFRATLQPGQGLICNNVLHDRSQFTDGTNKRLLYRARYYQHIKTD